jgi:hypothetical protein
LLGDAQANAGSAKIINQAVTLKAFLAVEDNAKRC